MTGPTSANSISSKRRDRSGSSATSSSTRCAVSICGALAHGALLNVTSDSTSFGCSDNAMRPPPRTARSRPVAAFTRVWIGPMNVLTSIVDSAMTMPTTSTSNRMPAPARIFHAVRMGRFYRGGGGRDAFAGSLQPRAGWSPVDAGSSDSRDALAASLLR